MLLKDLIPFLRFSLNDRDSTDYEYEDEELIKYLQIGVNSVEGSWKQGYSIVKQIELEEDEEGNTIEKSVYYIEPDPEPWLQMLYILKTAIMMKTFVIDYHLSIPAIRISNDSKKDDIKRLQEIYDSIVDERKYEHTVLTFGTWDDLTRRLDLIYNKVSENR